MYNTFGVFADIIPICNGCMAGPGFQILSLNFDSLQNRVVFTMPVGNGAPNTAVYGIAQISKTHFKLFF